MKNLLVAMITLTITTSVWAAAPCDGVVEKDCGKTEATKGCSWKPALDGVAAACVTPKSETQSTASQPCDLVNGSKLPKTFGADGKPIGSTVPAAAK